MNRRIGRRVVAWTVGTFALAGAVTLVVITTAPSGAPRQTRGGRLASTVTASVSASAPKTESMTTPVVVSGVVGEAVALTITPQIQGPLASIDIHPGERVSAGQVVARLSDTQGLAAKEAQAQAALAQAQSALDEATSPTSQPQTVAQAQNQVDAAQTALQSARLKEQADEAAASAAATATPSRGSSQAPSQQQRSADAAAVTAAQRQLGSAERYLAAVQNPSAAPSSQVSAAQSAVDAAQSGVDAADTALGELKVTSPASGVVAEVDARAGDAVSPAAPVARLAGSSSVVTARVAPMVAAQLAGHVGARASISLAVPSPPTAVKAHLGFVAPAADLQTQQTEVTLSADGGSLTPGAPVTATINVPLGRRLTVAASAISYVNGAAGVYVLTGLLDPTVLGIALPATVPAGSQIGTATFTRVTVLATVNGRSAIRGALPSGAQIITSGQTSLSTGQRVAVLPLPTAR